MVDNPIKVCFLSKRTHSRQPVLSWALSWGSYVATRRPRTARYETHSNRTPLGTSMRWVYDVMYMYVHVQTQSPQNSVAIKCMRKQCVSGALSLSLSLRLRTRPQGTMGPYAWDQEYSSKCLLHTFASKWCAKRVGHIFRRLQYISTEATAKIIFPPEFPIMWYYKQGSFSLRICRLSKFSC